MIPYLHPEFATALMELFASKLATNKCPTQKDKTRVTNTYYDRDADLSLVQQVETLIQSTSSWDGTPYKAYPPGQPQITVLRITLPPHTTMAWHSHPMPIAGYILSGELTIEKRDGTTKQFVAGQAVAETIESIHRGTTGATPVVVIAFCPGTPGVPVSQGGH